MNHKPESIILMFLIVVLIFLVIKYSSGEGKGCDVGRKLRFNEKRSERYYDVETGDVMFDQQAKT